MFTRWFSRKRKAPTTYRPTICLLEERTVLSGFWTPWSPPTPGPATHLEVEVPSNVRSGVAFLVLVEAKDASNHIASGYTGTIHFTLGTTDSNATLPADYPFASGDHGVHIFSVTLSATGSQTITATDTTTATITGSATLNVNPAPTATHFVILSPHYVSAGVPVTVTVIALDQYNHIATGYTGTVDFTTSDTNASVPIIPSATFSASDHGQETLQATFQSTGPQTLTATDHTTATITGQVSVNVEAVGSVTHFGLFSLGAALPGVATPVLLVALDANNDVVAGYTGTVHFSSTTDHSAVLPPDYTFLPSDNGYKVFSVTFNTVGQQSLTATDTASATVVGTANFYVPAHLRFPFWGWY